MKKESLNSTKGALLGEESHKTVKSKKNKNKIYSARDQYVFKRTELPLKPHSPPKRLSLKIPNKHVSILNNDNID